VTVPHRTRSYGWFALAGALLVASAPRVEAARLGLRYADGRASRPLPLERAEPASDEQYVSADALCDALGLDRSWKSEARTLLIRAGDHQLQVTVDTRLVLDGNTEIVLHVPVRDDQGNVLLPLEFVERVLTPAMGPGLLLDRSRLELAIGPGESDVLGIDYRSTSDGTEVRVRLARPLRYQSHATSDETVRLLLEDAKVDVLGLAADQPASSIRSTRAEQKGKNAALYFEVSVPVGGVTDRVEDDGKAILLTILPGQVRPEPKPSYVRPLVEVASAADSFDLIVLDAGHGGFDRGVAASGMVEKDVTLRLALAVQPILEHELGMRVLLLRSEDATLSAESRAEAANRAGADMLVSLHCNAAFGGKARGFEVLYASPVRTTAGDAVMAASRSGVADFSPWDTASLPYADRSGVLADIVRNELGRSLDGPNRGARAAPLELLRAVAMPAVQVECGFLTDADEASKLAGAAFPAQLAEGLVASVRKYLERYAKEAPSGGRP
jgi:N-acetylmuramoyl-L-alanine amidase